MRRASLICIKQASNSKNHFGDQFDHAMFRRTERRFHMVKFSFSETLPDRASFHAMLLDYYNTMIPMNPPEIVKILDAEEIALGFGTK
jgi:hypothetical protein